MVAYFVSVPPGRLRELIRDPDQVEDGLYPDEAVLAAGDALDIDKAWDGLHFLLTDGGTGGTDSPLGQAIQGGEPIDEYDEEKYGYGPPRALQPDEVRAVADALAGLSPEVLRQRFGDGRRLTADGVYPNCWGEADALDWLRETFGRLVAFYRQAADRGNAVLLDLV